MSLFDPPAESETPVAAPREAPATRRPEAETASEASARSRPEALPLIRVRAIVAYDGSDFAGFAPQPGGVRTVAGVLTDALGRVLGHPVTLKCAGRTDAGVHAWGQVVSFDTPATHFDGQRLQRSATKLLAPEVVVRSLEIADDPAFDARFSAGSRLYRYTVLNDPMPDPFLATTAWWVERPLDVGLLRLACDPLIGEHDFSSFCRRPKDAEVARGRPGGGGPSGPLVRRVIDARWEVEDGGRVLRFWIEANAFCHQMVRSIVGTLVDCGLGKRRPSDVVAVLRARDRSSATSALAPPHGLSLWEVRYPTSPEATTPH